MQTGNAPKVKRDHGFHPLRVVRVVPETSDASSIVLEVPEELKATYEYRAGQFLTFRFRIDDKVVTRSYSMSSSPDADDHLQVTVKRIAGGLVSNWVNDNVKAGDVVEASAPAGLFTLTAGQGDVVLFGAGSGITPVFSLLKTTLATTSRKVQLLYGNRDTESTIFRDRIEQLVSSSTGRAQVEHHLEVDKGFVDAEVVSRFVTGETDTDYYICGPSEFMDVVEFALVKAGVDSRQIHIERFLPAEQQPPVDGGELPEASGRTVEIDLYGTVVSGPQRGDATILMTARSLDIQPPYGCEAGNCGSCMAMLTEGDVTMHVNDALTDEEVEEGWVLTCQAVPTTPCVKVVFE
ncbi:MAG TPA: ferredoxin--NADP reductase [Nocardioides sp.]|nr:ferredoxin--NADP reductase [Nocardioides sp.]